MAEEKETKKKEVKGYELVEVPTQMTVVFRDNAGNLLDDRQAVLQILNDLDLLKKALL